MNGIAELTYEISMGGRGAWRVACFLPTPDIVRLADGSMIECRHAVNAAGPLGVIDNKPLLESNVIG